MTIGSSNSFAGERQPDPAQGTPLAQLSWIITALLAQTESVPLTIRVTTLIHMFWTNRRFSHDLGTLSRRTGHYSLTQAEQYVDCGGQLKIFVQYFNIHTVSTDNPGAQNPHGLLCRASEPRRGE